MGTKSETSFMLYLMIFYVVCSALLWSAGARAAESTVTLVSAEGTVDVNVDVWTAPEKWEALSLPSGEVDVAPLGRLLVFSGERYFWFRGTADALLDVLYLNADRQVIGVLENVQGTGLRSICEPALAVLLLPGGFIAAHRIATGNLLVSDTVSLHVQTMTTDRQRQTQLDVMIEKLSHAAHGNDTTAHDLGACYLSHRRYSQARLLYEKLSRKEKGSPASKMGIALAAAGEGQLDDAMQLLLDVIASDSANVDAYLHLARIFQHLKKGDAVASTLASGVNRHPEILQLRLALARLYIKSGALTQAETLLHSAPKPASTEEAKAAAKKDAAKDAAMISRVLGDVYLRRGKMAEAADAYRVYMDMFPYAPHGAELRLFIARHGRSNRESAGKK